MKYFALILLLCVEVLSQRIIDNFSSQRQLLDKKHQNSTTVLLTSQTVPVYSQEIHEFGEVFQDRSECNCPSSFECFVNDRGEPDCRCPDGKIEGGGGDEYSGKACIDCNCSSSYECFLNYLDKPDCRCPAGKIERGGDQYSEISCIDCDCPYSFECFLNDKRQQDCRCPQGTIERIEKDDKSCLDCNCPDSFECFLNDQRQTDCRCPKEKVEMYHNGQKYCLVCDCPGTHECFPNDKREGQCRCPVGKIEKDDNGIKSCLDCNCLPSYECFLNDQGQDNCRCPDGKIEKDDNGEKSCLDCNCHASQECFLNDLGFPSCRCSNGKIENEAYGIKFCMDCNCHPTQECFINDVGLADCRCSSGKIEKYYNGIKTCYDCDCGAGICVLDSNNVKKCHCGSKQVKGTDGRCYDCDCGVGICKLNASNTKSCHCGSSQAKGADGKCYECDCGLFGLCEIKLDGKKCTCAPFTQELDGKCIECDCGPHGLCSFESGRKKCVCSPYSVEEDGKCIAIETSTSDATESSSIMTTILSSTIPGCYCGSNSKSCSLDWAGNKNCSCFSGYSQIDGYCGECNCGPLGKCSFESDKKKCTCQPFAIEKNGLCIAMESTTSESTTNSSRLSSTSLPSTIQECYCGENSKSCYFNLKGDKMCDCYPGYSEDHGYCYECDCGSRGTCSFELMQKKCICDPYTSVRNGQCVDCNCGVNSQLCYFRRDDTKVCNCEFGYTEVNGYCSGVCNDDKCMNGKCEITEIGYKCRCTEGFTGLRCEVKVGAKSSTQDLWLFIQVSLVFVTFIFFSGLLFFMVCSKR